MRDLSTRAERHLGTYTYNEVWMSDGPPGNSKPKPGSDWFHGPRLSARRIV